MDVLQPHTARLPPLVAVLARSENQMDAVLLTRWQARPEFVGRASRPFGSSRIHFWPPSLSVLPR
jgi:hypothetical protein